VCLRSTWDYHLVPGRFRDWVAAFRAPGLSLWNPPDTVLWNADKVYLRELESAGIRIPATRWVEPGERPDLDGLFRRTGWTSAVLKPRVSASAHGTHLVAPGTVLSPEERAPLERGGALFQAFVPEIRTRGEVSLMFLAGGFSHAARKQAVAGEFRVQPHLGGTSVAMTPDPGLLRFGERILAAVPGAWVYARVDIVDAEPQPVLMELELIEPELFLHLAPPGRLRDLARALSTRLTEAA
jgi:hypothetical protein